MFAIPFYHHRRLAVVFAVVTIVINTTANAPTHQSQLVESLSGEVESFVYLGSMVNQQGGTDRDVTARIGKARAAFVMLKNIWTSGGISMRTKLRIFNSNVKSVLLYGCETWRTTQTMQQKIQTFFNTCLRRIYKIQWQEKIRNDDLWEPAGQELVAKQILRRKRGWIGHTLRKPASSIQHHTPSPDLEPALKEKERPTSQQLEARHWSRGETTRDQLVRNDQSSPEQSAMARGRWWPMLHRERWA